jgi:hypothetical protein
LQRLPVFAGPGPGGRQSRLEQAGDLRRCPVLDVDVDGPPLGQLTLVPAHMEGQAKGTPALPHRVSLDSVPVRQRKASEEHGAEHPEQGGGAQHAELDMLRQVLAPLAAAYLPELNIEALAYVALGGLYGAALHIAVSADPAAARARADTVLTTLITGLTSACDGGPADPRTGERP